MPGLQGGGYPSSQYQDAHRGADEAHPSDPAPANGRAYLQLGTPLPPSSWPEPRFDTYQASKQPQAPLGRSPHSERGIPLYSVQAARVNELHLRYPLGIAPQQSSGPMGPADEQYVLEGRYLQTYDNSVVLFVSQSLIKDNRTGCMMAGSASGSGSFTCTALSLICCLVALLTHHSTTVDRVQESVKFPSAPRDFDLSGERNLHPLMPEPVPFFRDTGRRRALVVCDCQAENYARTLISILDWHQLLPSSRTRPWVK